jgi:hypothetical protein
MPDYSLEELMAERARRQSAEQEQKPSDSSGYTLEQLQAEKARRQQNVNPEDNLSGVVEPFAQFGSGLARGAVGAPGIPGDIESLGRSGLRKIGLDVSPETYFPQSHEFIEAVKPGVKALQEEPKTVGGEYGRTIGEFVSTAGSGRDMLKYGVLPGTASETAGQLTKGTELEPWARGAGALVGAGVGSLVPGRPNVGQSLRSAVGDATAEQLEQAERLYTQSQGMGVPVSRFEALQQIMGGPSHAGDLQRVIEGSGRMKEFYGERPQQVEKAGREVIETVAPGTEKPSLIGKDIGEAAQKERVEAAASRTERASPYYKAAAENTVEPERVSSIIDQIDEMIRKDKTGTTHGPLEDLKKQLIDKPATEDSALVPVTDVENLDRVKKYWRDKGELPALAEKAIDKELSGKINNLMGQLDPAMEERSIPLRLGRKAYQEATRELLDPLLAGPIGKLAKEDLTTRQAIEALFPSNPLAQTQGEVADAVSRLVKKNPVAAKELVRAHIENTFNNAIREIQSGAPQYGGANFRKALIGHPQAASNLDAAVRALPNGDNIANGLNKFMEVMSATGYRQRPGSPTEFNKMIREQLQSGSLSQNAAEILLSAGTRWPGKVKEALSAYNEGRNLDRLAQLITDPAAGKEFAMLAQKNTPAEAARIIARIAQLEGTSARGTKGKFGLEYDDRKHRASGGKVGKRDYPAKPLSRMEKALSRAQNALAEETKPLMQMPDAQIAHALEIAKDK